MGIILNSAFLALATALYLMALGFVGPWGALGCYAVLGTCLVFVQALTFSTQPVDDQ